MVKQRTSIDEFLPAYLKAFNDGLSREDFAAQINVTVTTIYQRVYDLNRRLQAAGKPRLPHLKLSRRRPTLAERAAAVMEQSGAVLPGPSPDGEPEIPDSLADILG